MRKEAKDKIIKRIKKIENRKSQVKNVVLISLPELNF
jgi:hypothetical protein